MVTECVIGVDVGTGSVRAGLFELNGRMTRHSVRNIDILNPSPDFYEQSSNQIIEALKICLHELNPSKAVIKAICFSATCSLVLSKVHKEECSHPLSLHEKENWNIIMWLDHRAKMEAEAINSTGSSSLSLVGGTVSLEMELPKLMWLKKNRPDIWNQLGYAYDLCDFLTSFCTNNPSNRSSCSVVCKWLYHNHETHFHPTICDQTSSHWDSDLFEKLNLAKLSENGMIGSNILSPGDFSGVMTETASKSLGLESSPLSDQIRVSTGLIDAHAAALGCLALDTESEIPFENKISLICGTSTCHIHFGAKPISTQGIWGPYYIFGGPNGLYCSEAGQSAAGKLLDHLVLTSGVWREFTRTTISEEHYSVTLLRELERERVRRSLTSIDFLSEQFHVLPDFHGNRSPVADPDMKGTIVGLTLGDDTLLGLAKLYLAAIQALAYGTRHILETLSSTPNSPQIKAIVACGGLTTLNHYLECHATVCRIPIFKSVENSDFGPSLRGTAILATMAMENGPITVQEAIRKMKQPSQRIDPLDNETLIDFHETRYRVHLEMLKDQKKYRQITSGSKVP